jgi:maltose O-acetyltransferase
MKFLRIILFPFIELKKFFVKIIVFWPTGYLGNKLRYFYYSLYLKFGNNITIESGVRFSDTNKIEIKNECIFGRNVHINPGNCNGIYIGNYVAIADGTFIRSGNHKFDDLTKKIMYQGHDAAEINFNSKTYSVVIEDDVWIGARAILLSGAHIGEGSVISAGSVVSNKIPPYSIAVGNPARVVANRKMLKK